MSVLKVLPEMQQWDENHMYDPGDSTVIDYYIKSKLTTSYVFFVSKIFDHERIFVRLYK